MRGLKISSIKPYCLGHTCSQKTRRSQSHSLSLPLNVPQTPLSIIMNNVIFEKPTIFQHLVPNKNGFRSQNSFKFINT